MANKTIGEREIVLAVLLEITENGEYSHLILNQVLDKYRYLDKKERAFITRVTEGTLEHLIELDYIIDRFSKTKTKKMKPVIRAILRMSVYQLKYMDTVPAHAVCDEAVKLAVRKGFSGLKGFVNGVLRTISRNLEQVSYPPESSGIPYLSVGYSVPEWMIAMWEKRYPAEQVERILKAFQEERPLSIRCNLAKNRPEELKAKLESERVNVVQHPYLKEAFCISGFDHLDGLESFRAGLFFVQDVSSMLAGRLAVSDFLDEGQSGQQTGKENPLILDVCAAPGGKTLHMADLLAGRGRVEARDLTEYKISLIRENMERSGLSDERGGSVSVKQWDATVPDESMLAKADVVLADLPCSGLGILGRKADLRYRMTEESARELAGLQREILNVVAAYVKPGGVLLYSTCTIHEEENEKNAGWFLEEHPEYQMDAIAGQLPEALRASVEEGGMLQLLPGIHECDGFFIAKFKKRK